MNKVENRLAELANKLYNEKPNEAVIKSLNEELVIPKGHIKSYFFKSIKKLASNLDTDKTK